MIRGRMITKTRHSVQESRLVVELELAEKELLQMLEKGQQPTILDKLTELGYK